MQSKSNPHHKTNKINKLTKSHNNNPTKPKLTTHNPKPPKTNKHPNSPNLRLIPTLNNAIHPNTTKLKTTNVIK